MSKVITTCASSVKCSSGGSENIKLKLLEDKLRKDLAPRNMSELTPMTEVLSDTASFYVYVNNELKQIAFSDLKALFDLAGGGNNDITINSLGNWVINGVDSGIAAQGPKGDTGADGKPGIKGESGTGIERIEIVPEEEAPDGLIYRRYRIIFTDPEKVPFEFKVQNGLNGITPHVGLNGNWWIGDESNPVNDTGIAASYKIINVDPPAIDPETYPEKYPSGEYILKASVTGPYVSYSWVKIN